MQTYAIMETFEQYAGDLETTLFLQEIISESFPDCSVLF